MEYINGVVSNSDDRNSTAEKRYYWEVYRPFLRHFVFLGPQVKQRLNGTSRYPTFLGENSVSKE